MGGSMRLKFPLPHRNGRKQANGEVQSISAPMTNKAQKLLGGGEINIDTASPISPSEQSKVWDTRSAISGVSGISVTISETTASATVPGVYRKVLPDQESDIIPRGLGLSASSTTRSNVPDVTTDASSLRRRGSNSTIVSYYDKSKLPLSISQQTSSSAMAKGLPSNRGPLDMECPRPAPAPPIVPKKKPSRLDMSHLLPSSATSRLSRFSQRGKDNISSVLGSDRFTRSPSLMSTSPVISPAGSEPKPGKLRRKLTKESLKGMSSPRWSSFSSEPTKGPWSTALKNRATDTGNLNQLYEHYEQTSFRDTIDHKDSDTRCSNAGSRADTMTPARKNSVQMVTTSSPSTNKSKHHVSPSFNSVSWRPYPAYSPGEGCGSIAENPRVSVASSNLASPVADYSASVSSRHTRTSRASKTTESFADFDPNATSVLSLSSDSEDDYPAPPRTATSNPSLRSRDSIPQPPVDVRRRPSNTSSNSVEPARAMLKSRFRSSVGSPAPFLAIPEDGGATGSLSPAINPRSSSLSSAVTTNSPRPSISTVASSVKSQSRLSQVSMSTAESVPTHFSRPRPSATGASLTQAPEIRHIAMQSRTVMPTPKRRDLSKERTKRGPMPPLCASPQKVQPTPPMSPSSMEFIICGQSDSADQHNGPVLTLSGANTAGQERFIAVTPQEEMLLSAMRAKRAMMRENLQNEDTEASARSKAASKNLSLSSVKTITMNNLQPAPHSRSSSARNSSKRLATVLQSPETPKLKIGSTLQPLYIPGDLEEQEDILMCLDRTVSTMSPYDNAEPSPDLSDFIIDFDAEQFPTPPKAAHSRNTSTTSAAGRLTHPKAAVHRRKSSSGRPRPDSEFLPKYRPNSPEEAPPLPSSGGFEGLVISATTSETKHALEGIPSPSDSVVYAAKQSSQLQSRKKALRISAVGLSLPEMGQWGDDG